MAMQQAPEPTPQEQERQKQIEDYTRAIEAINLNEDQDLRREAIDVKHQLALTDSLTGSKLSKSFKKPTDIKSKLVQNIGALKSLQSKTGKSKGISPLDLIKVDQSERRISESRQKRLTSDTRQRELADNRARNSIHEKMSKQFGDLVSTSAQFKVDIVPIAEAFKSGNVSEIKKRIAKVAKYIGGHTGVLSDTDIKTTLGSNLGTQYEEARDWLLGKTDATISESQQMIYLDIVKSVISETGSMLKAKNNSLKNNYYALTKSGHTGFNGVGTDGIDSLHSYATESINGAFGALKDVGNNQDSVSTRSAAPQRHDQELMKLEAEEKALMKDLGL